MEICSVSFFLPIKKLIRLDAINEQKKDCEVVRNVRMEKQIVEGKSGIGLNRLRSKWLIFRLFLSVPHTEYPSKLSYDG